MLKKSYLGVFIWSIIYCALCFGVVALPIKDTDILVRIVYNITSVAMAVLAFIIYLNEKVFWYTGITYEQAVDAGSERRKIYALKHVKTFGIAAVIYLIVSLIITVFKASFAIDTVIFMVILLTAAISTMRFKL
ncbi:MAG: hypothetical protein IJ763_00910 [Lachnospiraceae bacterium]|nr:hypothetical protein [Lachnospiraceae bacterium]